MLKVINSKLRALMFIHLSNVLFAATAICISALSGKVDGYFTSFARFLVGALLGFGQLAASRTPFKIVRIKPWLGRGIFGAMAMTLYYLSIELGTPGRASLFNNSFPIFVALIAIVILRDPVKRITIAGILISFAGVLVVLWEGHATGGTTALVADLAGLSSGILAGISYHFNKRASLTENPIVIYLGVCFIGMMLNAFAMPQAAKLDWSSVMLLLLAGLGAYAAQISITVGLRDIDTTIGSIHTFLKIPLTVVAGAVFLSQGISMRFFIGTALLLAGLMLGEIVGVLKGNRGN